MFTEPPEIYVSWTDDGVILVCRHDNCKVPTRKIRGGFYALEIEVDKFYATPEDIVALRDKHVAEKHLNI